MDIYNINKYTDNELYQILEIPKSSTDRELEAKIIICINKYKDVRGKDGKAIHRFFLDVYNHFFEKDEEDDDDDIEHDAKHYENPILNHLANKEGFTAGNLTIPDNILQQDTLDGNGEFNLAGGISDAGNIVSNFVSGLGNPANLQDLITNFGNYIYKLGQQTGYTPPAITDTNKAGLSENQDISFDIGTQDPSTVQPTQIESMNTNAPDYTSSLSYTKGKLNPILKETIKRIISIDSQYRDISTYPTTTSYSFHLSDTLVDVVSLKLYSIQVPYTWYTINNNYGSNFFYIKGNSPGINEIDSSNNYQITIPSGNYTQQSIVDAVNLSMQYFKNINDISFNTLGISYNSSTVKSTITVDITRIFDESYYQLYFPLANSPQDPSKNTLSIPSFLGYNNQTYNFSSTYSKTFLYSTAPSSSTHYYDISADIQTTISSQLNKTYYFTVQPSFNIFLYTANNILSPSFTTDYTNVSYSDISFVNISNITPPVNSTYIIQNTFDPSSNKTNCIKIMCNLPKNYPDANNNPQTYCYTGQNIIDNINTHLSNNPYLSNSYITDVSVNTLTYISGQLQTQNQRFYMNIKLNRMNANVNNYNLKTAIQFPSETNSDPSNNPIFSDPTNNSLFCFQSPITDMSFVTINNFKSESPTLQTTYTTPNYPYILAKCTLSGYDTSYNDYIFTFPFTLNTTYDYTTYKSRLNTPSIYYNTLNSVTSGTNISYSNIISTSGSLPNNHVAVSFNEHTYDNVPQIDDISFNINRNFYNNDYTIDISNTSLTYMMGFTNNISFVNFHSSIYSYELYSDLYTDETHSYIPTPTNTISIYNQMVTINATNIQHDYAFTNNTNFTLTEDLLSVATSEINAYLNVLSTSYGLSTNTNYINIDCSYNKDTSLPFSFSDTNYPTIHDTDNIYRFGLTYTLPNFQIDFTKFLLATNNYDQFSHIYFNTTSLIIGQTVSNVSNTQQSIVSNSVISTSIGTTSDVIKITSINPATPNVVGSFSYPIDTSGNNMITNNIINFNNTSISFSNSSIPNIYQINNNGNIQITQPVEILNSYSQINMIYNINTNINTRRYKISLLTSSSHAHSISNSSSPGISIVPITSLYTTTTWYSSSNAWSNHLHIDFSNNTTDFSNNSINNYTIPCYLRYNEIVVNNTNRYFTVRPNMDYMGTGVTTVTSNPNSPITSYMNDIVYDIFSGGLSDTTASYQIEEFITTLNSVIIAQTPSTIPCIFQFSLKNDGYSNTRGQLQYSQLYISLNKIYTAQDYRLVFYDPYSFVYCNLGISGKNSAQNVTIDSTLGWILGYRALSEYYLTSQNIGHSNTGLKPDTFYIDLLTGNYLTTTEFTIVNSVVTIVGDTSVNVTLYNYFMITLDDYCQNRLNDGLVTITSTANDIALPSYANRATFLCSPNGENIIPSTGLTQNQIYSATQILNQQNKIKSYSSEPFVQDIFALIPVKTTGLQPGSPYIEFGGSLQLQDRTYFGPVNIKKLTVKLIDDKGSIINLNNANWSFSLVCEQLYNPNPQKK